MGKVHVRGRIPLVLLFAQVGIALVLGVLAPAAMAVPPLNPAVTVTVPASNATNVQLDGSVRATFSADINPLTITTSSFYIQEPGGAPLPAAVSYSATTKTATLKTLADLLPAHSYVVTLTSAILATDASALAPHTWSFITVASPAPAVTNLIPVAGAQNQALGQVISVSFSGEMDPATLTSSSFYIAKVKGNPLPAIIKYYGGVGSGIATLTPSAPLDPGSTYQVTLTAVVRGANGRTLSGAPITWSFSTVAGQPPQITSTVPVSGALDRPVDQMISVSFDKDMNPATLTAASFYIAPAAGGSPLASTIAYSAATKTATLAPAAALAHDTTYQVTLTSAVMSTSGLSVIGAPIVWTFKTAKAPIVFTDVPAGYRYAAAIYQMAARGVLSGFADGTFRPDDSVIRQEFAKMIVRTLGYPVSLNDVCPFTDVATSTPGHPVDPTDPFFPDHYIAVAAAHGVTQGFTPTTFLPYASISRYQVITMVVRALDNLHPGLLTIPPAGYQSTWDPSDSADHGQNARRAEFNGLLAGISLATIDPFAGMPRGEVAQILSNLVQLTQP